MATSTRALPSSRAPSLLGELRWTMADSLVMAKRNLLRYVRVPQLLVFSSVQPVMFILLFTYVFGGAIAVQAENYIDYLLPGILAQSVIFGTSFTGLGLAEDVTGGMIDRYRSLPMARAAVISGRILADTVRNTWEVLLMLGVGMLLGFRFHTDVFGALGVVALAVAFGFPFSWISAAIGMAVKDPETTQAAAFTWLFPVVFVSSAFVPVETMPGWLRPVAEANPFTVTVDALRSLSLGTPTNGDVWRSLAWMVGLTVLTAPLGIWQYRRM